LVLHTAQSLFSQIGAAFTTSFGNFTAIEDKTKIYKVYKKSRFIMNWMAAIIAICFMVLIQVFIALIFGENYVLNWAIVIILTLYLYAYLNNTILISVQNAMGLHKLDSLQMVFQTILNIILSIVGGILIGLKGILLGSLISMLIFSTLFKGNVIYEKVFNVRKFEYIKCLLNEYLRFLLVGVMIFFTTNFILIGANIFYWLIKGVIVFVLANVAFLAVSLFNPEIKSVKGMVLKLIKNRRFKI
jgi:O-antigen/teichoic acid export membrane protein